MSDATPIRVTLFERADPKRIPVATCHLSAQEGRGPIFCKLARQLVALGVDAATPLYVRRDNRPVFTRGHSVGSWAGLTVEEDEGRARLRANATAVIPRSASTHSKNFPCRCGNQ
jgi:hypothetical protein